MEAGLLWSLMPCILKESIKESRMPAHKKPTPERFCTYCGKKLERKRLPNGDLEYLIHFNARKFCDRHCMALDFDRRPVRKNPQWMTAHHHARKLCPPSSCVTCGKTGRTDVHHKDFDWKNNSVDNLARLCRSCHLKAHRGRKCDD